MNAIAILLLNLFFFTQDSDTSKTVLSENEGQYYIHTPTSTIRSASNGSTDGIVLLTIDDGPQVRTTAGFLDLLDEYNIKALFFINGYLAEPLPHVVHQILERGHMIGNHTWGHKRLSEEGPEATETEILKLNQWLENNVNYTTRYFRAPYGVLTPEAEAVLEKNEMTHIGWSVNSYDWMITYNSESLERDVDAIVRQTMASIDQGNIILLHDRRVSVKALELILEELIDKGYRFVLPTE